MVIQVNEAQWIGGRIEVNTPPAQLANREVCYYSKCVYGALTLQIGDFVLVSNADAAEPDTVAGCDVARILHLYEWRDLFVTEYPCRAVVQWYSRPGSIPHKVFDNDNILIDFDCEVIEEYRPYDTDIPLDAIYQRCMVICGHREDCAQNLLQLCGVSERFAGARFVCRYKYVRLHKKYTLLPLDYDTWSEEEPTCSVRRVTRLTVSPSKSGKKLRAASKRRRASIATTCTEFVDMSGYGEPSKVSPFKIVGGRSVVRLSASVAHHMKASEAQPTSPLAERNARVAPTPSQRVAARRNLNLSLDKEPNIEPNTTTDSDCLLNYSIVGSTVTSGICESAGEIKIKLRISERNQRATGLTSVDVDPLEIETDVGVGGAAHRKRLGLSQSSTPNDQYQTPSKRLKDAAVPTPSTRRKSILKSASRRLDECTPRRSIQLSNIVERCVYQEDAIIATPKRSAAPVRHRRIDDNVDDDDDDDYQQPTRRRSAKQSPAVPTAEVAALTPSHKRQRIRTSEIIAQLEQRPQQDVCAAAGAATKSDLQLAREQLHVATVPNSLPCREKEFHNIYNFLECKIRDQCGGCMYVSGVPGTGKTATVTSVIRSLQAAAVSQELPAFDYIEINGMRLTEPRQAYVQIYRQLTGGKTVSWEHAHALLEKRFTTPAPRRVNTVLLVDELDILCNRRQDVVYNLLDWPTKSAARLVVVTIANTMDLPERLLLGKVTSRLGLTRLTFQPYTYKQLEAIVVARLSGSGAFKGEAVQLVARKVAAVSGDARRALDICRRATELADAAQQRPPSNRSGESAEPKCVGITQVQQALAEMIASAKVQAIKSCSRFEQIFLRSVAAEVMRTGVEETTFMGVYTQMESIAAFDGVSVPAPGRCLRICAKLGSERLLICEQSRNDIFQKILLNVSTDDIHYALQINSGGL